MRERGSATILALALILAIVGVGLAVVAATQIVTARTPGGSGRRCGRGWRPPR